LETRAGQRDAAPEAPSNLLQEIHRTLACYSIGAFESIVADELKDKTGYITFASALQVSAGSLQLANPKLQEISTRTFQGGGPQHWMQVFTGLKEIWAQNSITGLKEIWAPKNSIDAPLKRGEGGSIWLYTKEIGW
jgi:hypothetical protein